jgi:hypothetical protein
MSFQAINIGSTANDGSGDPIRKAFSKINDGFAYLSTYIPFSTNISIVGNTISTSASNNSIVIDPNGSGNLIVSSNAVVSGTLVASSLGIGISTPTSSLHVVGSASITGVTSLGNLTVGNIVGSTNITGNLSVPNINLTNNINIENDVFVGGNIITNSGILHLANNKTPIQSINNVFVHFCDSVNPEYKLGIATVGLEYGNPSVYEIVIGTDVPFSSPNIYTTGIIVGNLDTFTGTFITPQVIGSYSQSISDPDFTIYTPGNGRTFIVSNLVLQQRTISNSIGSAGDLAGIISVDGSNVYVCTAPYDGVTAIWKYTSLTSF